MNLEERKEIARALLSSGTEALQAEVSQAQAQVIAGVAATTPVTAALSLQFPQGLAPQPAPPAKAPAPSAKLPKADVVVVTWTADEWRALANVLTPGFSTARWYPYTRRFASYVPNIRSGAPALDAKNLGSYMPTRVGERSVLCFKSSLHLNQDGKKTGTGTATLPVKDLFGQILDETGARVILTVGTSGSVYEDFDLGDVVVTRAAKFRCHMEFRNEPFNGKVYTSDWRIPTDHLDDARGLMKPFATDLAEPPVGPPTKRYQPHRALAKSTATPPDIKLEQDARDMPEFHPILTTDYFEFGTSANRLDKEGAAVEMGDAVLGLVAEERGDGTRWAAIRNMSDPQINGDLPTDYRLDQQAQWAVAYYLAYGYFTSVTGALATWGVLAGLSTSGLPA